MERRLLARMRAGRLMLPSCLGRVAAPDYSPAFQGRDYWRKNNMRRVATPE
jgi:hypothetical protein